MPDRKRTIGFSDDGPDTALAKGHSYLLAIGIDQYEHYPPLYNAVRDAREFVALMREKYGFSGERATVVTLFDAEATGENIQAQLEDLADRATPNDHCILYFSGHGAYNKNLDEGYWIPVDAKKGERRGYLHNSVVQKILSAIKSRHTFLIADSCFSGSMFVGTPTRDAADSLERDPSRWGLTSGRNEIVADGKPGENSPFAQTLLDLLRRSEQPLGVASLCAKMMEIVTANAGQTPRGEPLAIAGHRGGQYFFRPTDAEATAWKAAAERDTAKGYEGFLHKYPNSAHKTDATARLATLRADADWEHAERQHTQAIYYDFIEKHPKDARAATAEQRMIELADDQKWKEANEKGGLLDYNAYLRAYPQGRHAEKARNKIMALREPEPQPLPREPKVQTQKTEPPTPAPKANPPAPRFVPQPKAPPSAALTTFQKLSNLWAQNRFLTTSVFVLFLFFCWWVWGMLNKLPDLTKGKTQAPVVSTPPDTTKEKPQTSVVSTPPAPTAPDGFVLVKGGTFTMGCKDGRDADCSDDEKPAHEVTLPDFFIGKYEVTQAVWRDVMGNNPSKFKGCDQCPVENVSWNDIQDFLKKLNAKDPGKGYRLPTEAEWEYAARGGSKSKNYKYAGGNKLDEVAWYIGNSGNKTHPVGKKTPNELGIYDLSGNVWEWCADSWHGNYQGAPTDGLAWAEGGGKSTRVLRGGSWYFVDISCRSAYRNRDFGNFGNNGYGFRLARH